MRDDVLNVRRFVSRKNNQSDVSSVPIIVTDLVANAETAEKTHVWKRRARYDDGRTYATLSISATASHQLHLAHRSALLLALRPVRLAELGPIGAAWDLDVEYVLRR